MKKYNLAPGDFPDITQFSAKLNESKFNEFSAINQKQIDELDSVLSNDIPKLMEQLPSEKDSPETLKAKMGGSEDIAKVPIPTTSNKFGKRNDHHESNPFGYAADDEDHYWYVRRRK